MSGFSVEDTGGDRHEGRWLTHQFDSAEETWWWFLLKQDIIWAVGGFVVAMFIMVVVSAVQGCHQSR